MADHLLPDPANPKGETRIQFVNPTYPLTVEWVPRHLKMYGLNESDIDTLSSSGSALPLAFFGGCFGTCASFASVVLSGSVPDPKKFAVCLAVALSTGILSVFFLIWAVTSEYNVRRNRKSIKQGKVIETAIRQTAQKSSL